MKFRGINLAFKLQVPAFDNVFRRKPRGISPNYVVTV